MARGNQREKAREKNLKEQASKVRDSDTHLSAPHYMQRQHYSLFA